MSERELSALKRAVPIAGVVCSLKMETRFWDEGEESRGRRKEVVARDSS